MRSEILDSIKSKLDWTASNVSVWLAGGYENANDDIGAEVVRVARAVVIVRGIVVAGEKDEVDEEAVIAGAVVVADEEEEAFAITEETKVPKADDKEEDSVGRERAVLTTRCRAVGIERVDTRRLVRGTVVGESRSGSYSLSPEELLGSPSSDESSGNGSSFSHMSSAGCLRFSTLFPSPSSHWISVISALQLGQVESLTVHFTIHFIWKR